MYEDHAVRKVVIANEINGEKTTLNGDTADMSIQMITFYTVL